MKTRIMLGALIIAAVIGSSVGVGYAGSAGGIGGINLWQCYEVLQGSAPPHVLSMDDQFTDATTEQLGKLKLVCTPASGEVLNGAAIDVGAEGDHITCYEINQAHATPSVVTLNDVFSSPSGGQLVKVQGPSRFVCVFATKECHSGCPVITPP